MPVKRKQVDSKAREFFTRLHELIDNEYWKNQFERFADGNFPKGFKLTYEQQVPVIIYRYGKANYRAELSESEHEALFPLIEFLCKHGSFEPLEVPESAEPEPIEPSDNWRDYKKFGRMQLLQHFVLQLQQEHDLSDQRATELTSVLLTSAKQKLIKPEHVQMDNGQIVHITTLKIRSPEDIRFNPNYESKTSKTKTKEVDLMMKAMLTVYQHNRMQSKNRKRTNTTYMTSD